MLMYESASLSADGVTNAFFIFMVSYFYSFSQRTDHNKITKKELCIMVGLSIVTGMMKQTYIFLLLAYYLIPSDKFKNKKQYVAIGIVLFITATVTSFLWLKVCLGGQGLLMVNGAIPSLQTKFIIRHPFEFLMVLCRTAFNSELINSYLIGFVGYFGMLRIPLPSILSLTYLFMLYNISLFTRNDFVLDIKRRILLLLIFLGCVLAVFAALYITWTTPEAKIIEGVQGRYFIPAILPLLLSLSINRESEYLNKSSIVFIVFLLCFSLTKIVNYFYL